MPYLGLMEFDNKHLARIKKVCKDTFDKDATFIFKILSSKFKRDKILIVSSETKDITHRRLTWLVKKVLKGEDEGKDFYYWIKEVKK